MTPAERARLAALAEAATPGPWEVHRESDGARVTHYGMTVAWCGTSLAISREGRWEISREQAHANAALFAAVPELLAALTRLAKLEAVAEAAREFRRWDAILALTLGEGQDAEDAQDDLRAIDTALAALDGGE